MKKTKFDYYKKYSPQKEIHTCGLHSVEFILDFFNKKYESQELREKLKIDKLRMPFLLNFNLDDRLFSGARPTKIQKILKDNDIDVYFLEPTRNISKIDKIALGLSYTFTHWIVLFRDKTKLKVFDPLNGLYEYNDYIKMLRINVFFPVN